MTEVEQQQPLAQNGIDAFTTEEDDHSKSRPADIEQDMREMERRKRVEAIMSSKLFREELERIVDSARDGGTSGIIQQLSNIVGIPMSRVGGMFRASSCLLPINDIRGVESMGYAKGEKILRCKLAATFRLLDLYGWTGGLGAQVTARLKVDQEYFLVNPYGLLYNEITASALNKVDMQGQIVEQGTTNFAINKNHFILHSVVHAARPDIRCAIYIGCNPVLAISLLKTGLLPITKDACILGEITTFNYTGYLFDEEERNKLVRNLGPISKVILLSNHGALCCGETIEEAFFAVFHIIQACETQLKVLPVDLEKLVLIPEDIRKIIYDQARRPPEDFDKKRIISSNSETKTDDEDTAKSPTKTVGTPKWRVGGAEFEALMRMLDNAGFRTGYIYRHPLVKSEPPKPKSDVELPPAVSSLGYLLEEEELFRQGIWKRGDLRKGGDRSRWLNSPNVYQKVEVLETGTPDPKKITKWVAECSPTHSTPVRIEDPLQFVPVNTNPKEFKRVQQQIKDNRRADKISAGPQSHILEGVTWDEANRIKESNVNSSNDHVVLVGAASKGIIQRGFQHNATVYKAPYAKNPFDCVTDDELNEYKRTIERKKKSIYGEYTDTDFSESEALSSQQTSGAQPQIKEMTTTTAAISQSEPEDASEHQVMRIQTQQAPVRSQPEIVLSDEESKMLEYNQESNEYEYFDSRTQDIHKNRGNKSNNNSDNDYENNKTMSTINNIINNNNNQTYYDSKDVDFVNDCQKQEDQQRLQENQSLMPQLELKSLSEGRREKLPIPFEKNNNDRIPYKIPPMFYNNNEKSTNNDNEYNAPYAIYNTLTDNKNYKINDNINSNGESYNDIHMNFSNNNQYLNNNDDENVYDYINPRNVYANSQQCHTPNICPTVLGSLEKGSKNDNEKQMKKEHLRNIPYYRKVSYFNSPISTSEKSSCYIRQPQKYSKMYYQRNVPYKCYSSYRTLSHFGFNPPKLDPKPEHKHIPLSSQFTKYVPSMSYEELFASSRFLDVCEHCFEKLVRLKLELNQSPSKICPRNFRNTESMCTSPAFVYFQSYASRIGDDNKAALDIVSTLAHDTISDRSMDTNAARKSLKLEPLIESEERDNYDSLVHTGTRKIVNCKSSHLNIVEDIIDTKKLSPIQTQTPSFQKDEKLKIHCINEKQFEGKDSNQESQYFPLIENDNINNIVKDYDTVTKCFKCNKFLLNKKNTFKQRILKTNLNAKWPQEIACEIIIGNMKLISEERLPSCSSLVTEVNSSLHDSDAQSEIITITTAAHNNSEQEKFENLPCSVERGESISTISFRTSTSGGWKSANSASSTEFQSCWDSSSSTGAVCRNSKQEWTQKISGALAQIEPIDIIDKTQSISITTAKKKKRKEKTSVHKLSEYTIKKASCSIMKPYKRVKRRLQLQQFLHDNTQKNVESMFGKMKNAALNKIQQSFEFTFPSAKDIDNGKKGEAENVIDAEIYYGQTHIMHRITPINSGLISKTNELDMFVSLNFLNSATCLPEENTRYSNKSTIGEKVEINMNNDVDAIDNLLEVTKDNFQNVSLYTHSPNAKKKLLSSTLLDNIESNSFNLTNEFDSIISNDYKNNSNAGTYFNTISEEIKSSQTTDNTTSIQIKCSNNNNKDKHNDGIHRNFSPIEQEILDKIQVNKLNKSNEIFDKIENTIRHRKMDTLFAEQGRLKFSTQSTPTCTREHYNNTVNKSSGTCRSLMPLKENMLASVIGDGSLDVKKSDRVIQNTKKLPRSKTAIYFKKSTSTLSTRRNFILENIRNASKPLRHNIGRNLKRIKAVPNKNPNVYVRNSPSNRSICSTPISLKSNDSTNVYSFQSKCVKNSQKLWVTLPNSPEKKILKTHTFLKSLQRNKINKSKHDQANSKKNYNINKKYLTNNTNNSGDENNNNNDDNSITVKSPITMETLSEVGAEVQALGDEIHQIRPRIENYSQNVEKFGKRILTYARDIAQQK